MGQEMKVRQKDRVCTQKIGRKEADRVGRARRPRSHLFDAPTFSVRLTRLNILCPPLRPLRALRSDRSNILY